MTAEVLTLKGAAPAHNDRKALLLQAVSESFDLYVKDFGEEPDCIVYVLGGLKQTVRPGWQMSGESEGGGASMRAAAVMALINDMTRAP